MQRMGMRQRFVRLRAGRLILVALALYYFAGGVCAHATQAAESAASAYEYRLKVSSLVRELRLFVLSIANAEPVEKRRAREGFLEESVEGIIFEAQGNPEATINGTFYTYEKADV